MAAVWNLIIEDDAGRTIRVPFTRDVITIGRKEGNTIRLTERNVSRNHARLSKDSGHVFIEDVESYNGIKLNGEKIQGRVAVQEGDLIQIGDYHLELRQERAQAQPPQVNGHDNGATAAVPAPVSGIRSSNIEGEDPEGDDDEFAGDTQRWEPPSSMNPLSVGAATQEERRPVDSEPTTRALPADLKSTAEGIPPPPLLQPAPPPRAGLAAMMPQQDWPPPRPTDLDATLRQAPSTLEPTGKYDAPTAPHMPVTDPSPRTPPASFNNLSRALTEETEQLRPSPAVYDDAQSPRLVAINTVFAGSAFSVRKAEMVIGRTEDNDIVIEHRSVSRNHARIVREADRVRIFDLKSANGVLVNDQDVDEAVLKAGDIVELGRVRLRFVPAGERFVLPPEEIERARIADVQSEDFEGDTQTHVTGAGLKKLGPLAPPLPPPPAPAPRRNSLVLVALFVAALMLAVTLLVIFLRGPDEAEVVDDAPVGTVPVAVPATPSTPATPMAPDTVAAIEAVKVADAKRLLGAKAHRDAMNLAIQVPSTSAVYAEAQAVVEEARANLIGDALMRLDRAESEAGDEDTANLAREDLRSLDPKHPRLKEASAGTAPKRDVDAPRRTKSSVTTPNSKSSARLSAAEFREKLSEAKGRIMAADHASALPILYELEKQNADDPDVQRSLGVANAGAGNSTAARRHYRKYLKLRPDAADADRVIKILEEK